MSAPTPNLPAARNPGTYAVALICLGNICRSPTAHVVLDSRIAEAGLADRVTVSSCGTAGWHIGKPMDRRAAATLSAADYDPSRHRARQFDPSWAQSNDLILAMDEQNLADLGGHTSRIRLFGEFDPVSPGVEVPDPYYGGDDGFADVLAMVSRTAEALTSLITQEVSGGETPEALR